MDGEIVEPAENSSTFKLRNLILKELTEPTIFREFISNWPAMQWDLETWSLQIGSKMLPFRVGPKKFSKKPLWEGDCTTKQLSFNDFIASLKSDTSKVQWCYFDYKHMLEWFQDNPSILQSVDWSALGFPERGGKDSTLWISSEGAHTPCHIDTYGCNLVAQVLGKKQWILFPPNSDGLKPTRVPYEESSIFSEINFYSPSEDLSLQGARVVVLNPGDVLFVPAGWWHYVETVSTAAVSINTWIPLPEDKFKQVDEALVKMWVSTVSRFSPSCADLLNPNEADVTEDMNVMEYMKRAVRQCQEAKSFEPVAKKPRTSEIFYCPARFVEGKKAGASTGGKIGSVAQSGAIVLSDINMSTVGQLSVKEFQALMEQKAAKFKTQGKASSVQDENFEFCKNFINAVCDKQVLDLIAKKLLQTE